MENINDIMSAFPSPTSLVLKREAKIANDANNVRIKAAKFWQTFAKTMIAAAEEGKDFIKDTFPSDVDSDIAKELLLAMNGEINGVAQKYEYTIELGMYRTFVVHWKVKPQYESNETSLPEMVF